MPKHSQAAFDFIGKNKTRSKKYNQSLIAEYNRVLLGLAKKLDSMEAKNEK